MNVMRRTLRAIVVGMNHWPDEEGAFAINNLVEWGWQVVDLLHQGAEIRIKTPSFSLPGLVRVYRTSVVVLEQDAYACPDQYVDGLVASPDAFDEALHALVAGKPVEAEPKKACQSLTIRFDMTAENFAAARTYAEANHFSLTDAINRLVQCGGLILQSERGQYVAEYRREQGRWSPLPLSK